MSLESAHNMPTRYDRSSCSSMTSPGSSTSSSLASATRDTRGRVGRHGSPRAWQAIRRDRPELVILDVGLPDGDGIRAPRERSAPRATSRSIMLTARGDLDDRMRGLDLGADDYIAKPFHFTELLARVRAHLRRRGSRSTTILSVASMISSLIREPARCTAGATAGSSSTGPRIRAARAVPPSPPRDAVKGVDPRSAVGLRVR